MFHLSLSALFCYSYRCIPPSLPSIAFLYQFREVNLRCRSLPPSPNYQERRKEAQIGSEEATAHETDDHEQWDASECSCSFSSRSVSVYFQLFSTVFRYDYRFLRFTSFIPVETQFVYKRFTKETCATNPCLNNGKCTPGKLACECATGWMGRYCHREPIIH